MANSLILFALCLVLAIVQAVPTNVPRNIYADELIRLRCSHNPDQETYYFFNGTVTAYLGEDTGSSFLPTSSIKPLFNAVGINIARCYKGKTGNWYLVGREAMWYIKDDKIMSSWNNILTNNTAVNVVHVDNDPVMQTFAPNSFPITNAQVYGDQTIMPSDVTQPLNYANPLYSATDAAENAKFAPYAPQKFYQAAELFKFISPTAEVFSDRDSVDSSMVAWTRTSQFLPWMKMGDRKGYLLYSFQGSSIPSYENLPYAIKKDIEDRLPHYKHAPDARCYPNMTGTVHRDSGVSSWTFFKENFDAYLAGAQFPLANGPRTYACKTGAAFEPAEDVTCKASASVVKGNSWNSNGEEIAEYKIQVVNVGTKPISAVSVKIDGVSIKGKWNFDQVGSTNVYSINLWGNNVAAGSSTSDSYGMQVVGNPTISVASVTCA